jgi:ATP-dependent helicase/nuclease subunit A
MIARRLLQLVAEGVEQIYDCDDRGLEFQRQIRFSDMAILCRKRAHYPPLENALRKYGVPFIAHGSVGFYKTQEIYDTVNYLRTLLNSRDEIALLGVLRSPYFCVSDTELYRIATIRGDESGRDLWSRAVMRATASDAEDALVRAVAMIGEDRSMASRIPVSLLIRRVLEKTGWRGAVAGSDRGEQVQANLDKLLEMAREFEERGFTNLFDFVERLTALIELEEMEGEASVNTGRDAVRIMTMHAAKGLEFPLVVIPSLHSTVRNPSQPYFDKELGFGWSWKFDREEYKPMILALMNLREQERGKAEEARLFYVAITRARDMLILSGEYSHEKGAANTMLEWALAPFGEVPSTNTTLELVTPALTFLEPDGIETRTVEWTQSVPFHVDLADLPKYAP